MKDIGELTRSLTGATHANVQQIGDEICTAEFLDKTIDGMTHAWRMMQGVGAEYHPSEFNKVLVHYCVRHLIQDLWESGVPELLLFIDNNGRFILENGLGFGGHQLTSDLSANLEIGKEIICEITSKMYREWIENLKQRNERNGKDPIPLIYMVYHFHSALIHGGDMSQRTIMDTTFTRAGKEHFEWLSHYPNLSREEIETIARNSIGEGIKQASQLAIGSFGEEDVVKEATERDEIAYILDPVAKKIVLDPKYRTEVERTIEESRRDFFDRTGLVLTCPAKFVPSQLYDGGNMLYDLLRFRNSVFVEIYLATHNRR